MIATRDDRCQSAWGSRLDFNFWSQRLARLEIDLDLLDLLDFID